MEKLLNGLPVEEVFIDDVFRMGIVTKSAIERDDFILLSDEEDVIEFKAGDEEQVITGIALVPNKPIRRKGKYIFFSEETVKKASLDFFKNNHQNESSLEHMVNLNSNTVFESWIVTDPSMDKSLLLGFKDVPKGSWMISMKINDKQIWDDFLKTGIMKGFSIEAKQDKNIKIENMKMLNLKSIMDFFRNTQITETAENVELATDMNSAMLLLEFSNTEGRSITVDDSLIATYADDGSIVPEGEATVNPMDNLSSIWKLSIGIEGRVMSIDTPWDMETTVEETVDMSAVLEVDNLDKATIDALNLKIEGFSAVEETNILLKSEISELKTLIETMKKQVNAPIILKSNEDRGEVKVENTSKLPDMKDILKGMDERKAKK